MQTIALPVQTVAALAQFMGVKDVRYYLNGMCLEIVAGTARLVATDGHVAGVAIIAEGIECPDQQIIIPDTLIKVISKHKQAMEQLIIGADGELRACNTIAKAVDGEYPNWRRIIKAPAGEQVAATFDVDILARIGKAAKLAGEKTGYFTFHQAGDSAAAFTLLCAIVGVVMPLRGQKGIDPKMFNKTTGA